VDQPRIAELLEPFLQTGAHAIPLTPTQLNQISTYIDLLIRWNARINLTAIRTPDEIVTRHFGESLFAARHLFPWNPANPELVSNAEAARSPLLVDLGSGAGFPGLPIKIWSPRTPVTLIESNHKKVAFLREVIRELTLTSIDVFPGRAEDFPAQAGTLTLRAVERFEATLPIAVSLLSPAATLALLISRTQLSLAQFLARHLLWSTPSPIPQSTSRILLTAKTNPAEPKQ
jgi:16S rRNA (guanine527-N7)-methyltransferase